MVISLKESKQYPHQFTNVGFTRINELIIYPVPWRQVHSARIGGKTSSIKTRERKGNMTWEHNPVSPFNHMAVHQCSWRLNDLLKNAVNIASLKSSVQKSINSNE